MSTSEFKREEKHPFPLLQSAMISTKLCLLTICKRRDISNLLGLT